MEDIIMRKLRAEVMQRATRAGAASGAMKNFVYRETCNMVSGMKTLVQKVAGLRLKLSSPSR